MIERHLRLPAVIEATGLSRSTIYDKMKGGTFPRPVNLSARAVAWPESVLAGGWRAANGGRPDMTHKIETRPPVAQRTGPISKLPRLPC